MTEASGNLVAIAANPYSGAKKNRELVDALETEIRRLGLEPILMWDKAELAERSADAAFVEQCRCIVAAGGDGTILHVINSETKLPLVHFPLGNENLFASHFGVTADPSSVAAMIEAGRTQMIDLGRANGTLFTCVASAGFDAEVVRRLDAWRAEGTTWRRVKRITYARPILGAVFGYRYPLMTMTTDDGKKISGSAVFVFNLPRYGMGLPICPTSCGDDGLLDYVVLENRGNIHLAQIALSVIRGKHLSRSDVQSGRAKRITIECDTDVPLEIDGDLAGSLPVTIEAVPNALEVIVP